MKYFLMVLSLLSIQAGAGQWHVSAPVVAAKLYTQEAEIVRTAKVHISEAGMQQIWVNPALGNDIADISVQVDGARLVGQGMRPIFDAKEQDGLWQKIQDTQRAVAVTAQAIADNTGLAQALTRQAEHSSANIADLQKQLVLLNQSREQLLMRKQTQDAALQALQLQAKWQGKNHTEVAQAAVFDVYAEQPGDITLTLRERTDRASWQPYSEFYLNSISGKVTVRAGAKIAQNTGLDWQNTALTLAVTPPYYQQRPTLQSITVAVADKVTAALNDTTVLRNKSAEFAAMPTPLTAMALRDNGAPGYSDIVSNGLDFEVLLSGRYHLNSGGERYQLSYLEETVPAKIYSAVYAWTNQHDALLIGHWTLLPGKGFIPGNTTVYRDNNRLASLYINRILSGGSEQTLSFGKDPQLTVDYRTPPGYTAGNGIIIKDKVLEQRESIRVKNLSAVNKTVYIYTRIPVTTQSEVSVEGLFKPQPTETNAEDIKGISLWRQVLLPGKEMNVESGYDIRYPEGKRLIGIE